MRAWDQPLDAAGVELVRELTQRGWTVKQIMLVVRRQQRIVAETQKRLGIYRGRRRVDEPDPTPRQIRERAAAIRRQWRRSVRERRYVGGGRSWSPTVVPASILRLAAS